MRMIDGTSLARAAEHARTALTHVDAAAKVDVPSLFGRSAANAEVRQSMGRAATSATEALVHLGDDAALVDTRRAVETLREAAMAIRDRGAPVSSRHSRAILDAREGVRLQATTLDQIAALAGSTGHAPTTMAHAPTLGAAAQRLGATPATLPPWLADATGAVTVGATERAAITAAMRLSSSADVADEVHGLLTPIVDDMTGQLTRLAGIGMLPDPMLASLDEGVAAHLKRLPRLLRDDWDSDSRHDARYVTDRLWTRSVAANGDGERFAIELADQVPTADGARQLGLLLEHDAASFGMPDDLRYAMSAAMMDVDSQERAVALYGALRTVRTNPDPSELLEEARSLVGAHELSRGALERLAVLDALPRQLRPLRSERALERLDELTGDRLAQLHDDLRWSVERADLLRDPAAGSRAVVQEVLGYVARGDEPFSRADVLRLARLQELGTTSGMPTVSGGAYSFREIARRQDSGAIDLSVEMRRLRARFEQARVYADPSISRTTQVRDLGRILSQPDEQLDLQALQRIRAIEEVQGYKGLQLPTRFQQLPSHMLDDAASGRGIAPELAAELETLRAWLATWHVQGADDLARIAAMPDRPSLPPHVMTYIDDNWDVLAADPASIEPLTRLVVQSLNAANGRHLGLASAVRLADQIVRSRRPADAGVLRDLYDQTLETIQRNAERMDGTRQDTYDLHPDYAELGRIAANLPVLSHGQVRPAAIADDAVNW